MPIEQMTGPKMSAKFCSTQNDSTASELELRENLVSSLGGSPLFLKSNAKSDDDPSKIDQVVPSASGIAKTSCTYRGETYFGDYIVKGNGAEAIVSVRRHGAELTGTVGDTSITAATSKLLQEIVTRETIASVVVNGSSSAIGRR